MNIALKLNSSTELIPISRRTDESKSMANSSMKTNNSNQYFSDPLLIPRVKQYLEDHSNTTYVDIDHMVDELQSKYRDYTRRKRNAFKIMVHKAFTSVLQSCGVMANSPSSSEPSDEEMEMDDMEMVSENHKPNSNEDVVSMYLKQDSGKSSKSPSEEDKELINISSDEDVQSKKAERMHNLKKNIPASVGNTTITAIPSTQNNVKKAKPPMSNSVNEHPSQQRKPVTRSSGEPLSATTPPPPVLSPPPPAVPTSVPTPPVATQTAPAVSVQSNRKKAVSKGSQKKKKEANVYEPTVTFKNIGGNTKVLEEVCKLLVHIRHPDLYNQLGISPPRGFLLHGPPGCGKSLLAHAIAGELQLPLIKVVGPELVAGVSGESEERIRDLFDQAINMAPCVLFLDEVDAITPNRHTAQREMERRIVAQLLSCLDDLGQKENGTQVLVIGATNRPDSLDPALRRAGRFDREVCLGIPDQESRTEILRVLCSGLKLAPNFDFDVISKFSPGFVGADLLALVREAAIAAVNRVFSDLKKKSQISNKILAQENDNIGIQIESTESTIDWNSPKENGNGSAEEAVGQGEEMDEINNEEIEGTHDSEEESPPAKKKKDDDDNINSEGTVKDVNESSGITDNSTLKNHQEASEHKPENLYEKFPKMISEQISGRDPPSLQDLLSWLQEEPPLTKEDLEKLYIEMEDFAQAMKCVQPSAKREGFATVPDVTWDDVGSLKNIREELQMTILAPVRHPQEFASLGLLTPTGVLLCGPPGCGKTLLAKAIANEAGINFISVKGPELLNMYVGESERAVRQCFQRARNSAPCVIFFDELDSLCPKRSDSRESGASMRVVNQMLTEMDGIEERKGVFLMAATNRPDIVDPAVLRPGRLDKILYVGLPTAEDRVDILRTLTKNGQQPLISADVDLNLIAKCEQCEGYSGADLAAVVREAGVQALKELMSQPHTDDIKTRIENRHFQIALQKVKPSVSKKDRIHYEKLCHMYSAREFTVHKQDSENELKIFGS